jgi:Ni/Co efflux regulator RcnB
MKKLIIILIATVSFSAASAQSNDRYDRQHRGQVMQQDTRNYNDQRQSNDYAYNNNNGWKNDRDHQAAYDRMNQQYDQSIAGYRNDRSLRSNERDRRIKQAEQERQQQSRSFGTGTIIGGVAGFLLGVLVSH